MANDKYVQIIHKIKYPMQMEVLLKGNGLPDGKHALIAIRFRRLKEDTEPYRNEVLTAIMSNMGDIAYFDDVAEQDIHTGDDIGD